MKIAITGASGHIGANLVRLLLSHGHEINVLLNRDDAALRDLSVKFIPGNLADPGSLQELVSGCKWVFHLAGHISISGKEEEQLQQTNVQGTLNMIHATRSVPGARLIHFSSIHALIQHPYDRKLDENRGLALNDRFAYSRSKAMAESLVFDAAKNGLDALIVNPTSVIGPFDFKPSLMGNFIIRLYRKQLPFIITGGYDFVDARDVAMGALLAAQKGKSGESYLLSGAWHSFREISLLVSQYRGHGRPSLVVPALVAETGLPFIQAYNRLAGRKNLYTRTSIRITGEAHRHIDSGKASRVLGYAARPVEETIHDSLEWFRNNNYLG